MQVAASVRERHQGRERARLKDLAESAHIYDMGTPHAVDALRMVRARACVACTPPLGRVALVWACSSVCNLLAAP